MISYPNKYPNNSANVMMKALIQPIIIIRILKFILLGTGERDKQDLRKPYLLKEVKQISMMEM